MLGNREIAWCCELKIFEARKSACYWHGRCDLSSGVGVPPSVETLRHFPVIGRSMASHAGKLRTPSESVPITFNSYVSVSSDSSTNFYHLNNELPIGQPSYSGRGSYPAAPLPLHPLQPSRDRHMAQATLDKYVQRPLPLPLH